MTLVARADTGRIAVREGRKWDSATGDLMAIGKKKIKMEGGGGIKEFFLTWAKKKECGRAGLKLMFG